MKWLLRVVTHRPPKSPSRRVASCQARLQPQGLCAIFEAIILNMCQTLDAPALRSCDSILSFSGNARYPFSYPRLALSHSVALDLTCQRDPGPWCLSRVICIHNSRFLPLVQETGCQSLYLTRFDACATRSTTGRQGTILRPAKLLYSTHDADLPFRTYLRPAVVQRLHGRHRRRCHFPRPRFLATVLWDLPTT